MPDLALRLRTSVEVLVALETGDTVRLPPWPETVRVVTAYTGLARIDPGPILGFLGRQLAEASATQSVRPQETGERPAARGHRARPEGIRVPLLHRISKISLAEALGRLSAIPRPAKRTGVAVALLVLIASMFGATSGLQASFATLHPPLARLVRSAEDYLLWRAAPVRDGMRWIQVDDPRTRKGDRLATRRT